MEQPVAELARQPDSLFLQRSAGGHPNFSRFLRPVEMVGRFSTRKSSGGPRLPGVKHQGIEDSFLEKASIVHYFHNGRWLNLQGAD
jgi:hypothetical protein